MSFNSDHDSASYGVLTTRIALGYSIEVSETTLIEYVCIERHEPCSYNQHYNKVRLKRMTSASQPTIAEFLFDQTLYNDIGIHRCWSVCFGWSKLSYV